MMTLLTASWILKSTLFFILILILYGAVRRQLSASQRHVLLVAGFAGMLLIPFFASVTESLHTTIPVDLHIGVQRLNYSSSTKTEVTVLSPVPQSRDVPVITEDLKTMDVAGDAESSSRTPWLYIIWISGIVIFSVFLLLEKIFLTLLRKKAADCDLRSYELMDTVRHEMGVTRPVRIAVSRHIDIPFTAGWLKPVVFVPARFSDYSPEKQRFVFLHEMAHIRRWDGLNTWITQLGCAIFWFNPLVWLAARWSKLDMEKACDDFVIGTTKQRYDYASLILDVIESSKLKPLYLQNRLAMANKNELRSRMHAILDDKVSRKSPGRVAMVAGAALTLLILIPLAAMRLADASDDNSLSKADVSAYVQQLTSSDYEEVKYSAWALGTAENRQSVDALEQQLNHPDAQVRSMVIWALGEIKDPSSLDQLTGVTDDPVDFVREMTAKSIGELEDSQANKTLKTMLQDPSPGVRTAAVWALGEIGNRDALSAVLTALHDAAPEVTKMAIKVLWHNHYLKAVTDIEAFLTNRNEDLKIVAIQALGQLKQESSLPGLIRCLEDESAFVRREAAIALGRLGNEQAARHLMPLLQDPDTEVREMTVWALDELKL